MNEFKSAFKKTAIIAAAMTVAILILNITGHVPKEAILIPAAGLFVGSTIVLFAYNILKDFDK